MMSRLLSITSTFLFITSVLSNPIAQRDGQESELPITYAALGDSYASGLGSGFFTSNSRDGSDVKCLRQDGSYPNQLLKLFPQFVKATEPFDNVACGGGVLADIDGQIERLEGKKFDLITLTIGGNDFGFGDIAETCVYPQILPDLDAQELCTATFDIFKTAASDPDFWTSFASKLHLIKNASLSSNGRLLVTGYARFFGDPVVGDACEQLSFFPIPQLAALNMTAETRRRANELTDLVNKGVEDTVFKVAKEIDLAQVTKSKRSWWKLHHPSSIPPVTAEDWTSNEGHQIQFINMDKHFASKRFCEQNNAADPIGSNNPQVFFTDLTTLLATPGKAPEVKQATAIAGANIGDKLQQISAFHPKGALAYQGLVAEIALRILGGAARSKEVITGPAEYCVEKKSHAATWTRDPPSSATESSTNEKYRTHHCYRIPASCAAVKPVKAASWKEGDAVKAPTVVCQEGWKMSDADKVEWRDEWDW